MRLGCLAASGGVFRQSRGGLHSGITDAQGTWNGCSVLRLNGPTRGQPRASIRDPTWDRNWRRQLLRQGLPKIIAPSLGRAPSLSKYRSRVERPRGRRGDRCTGLHILRAHDLRCPMGPAVLGRLRTNRTRDRLQAVRSYPHQLQGGVQALRRPPLPRPRVFMPDMEFDRQTTSLPRLQR